MMYFFFFNDTATTEIYTLSLHDALPIFAGTDYVYPRTTNKILEAYLKSKGVKSEDIMINYTPFGHSDWQTIVSDIKKFGSTGKKTAVVSKIGRASCRERV